MVDTSNIALILFLKCDVTKFRIPPPLFTEYHISSTPSAPLTFDVIYGFPLSLYLLSPQRVPLFLDRMNRFKVWFRIFKYAMTCSNGVFSIPYLNSVTPTIIKHGLWYCSPMFTWNYYDLESEAVLLTRDVDFLKSINFVLLYMSVTCY